MVCLYYWRLCIRRLWFYLTVENYHVKTSWIIAFGFSVLVLIFNYPRFETWLLIFPEVLSPSFQIGTVYVLREILSCVYFLGYLIRLGGTLIVDVIEALMLVPVIDSYALSVIYVYLVYSRVDERIILSILTN